MVCIHRRFTLWLLVGLNSQGPHVLEGPFLLNNRVKLALLHPLICPGLQQGLCQSRQDSFLSGLQLALGGCGLLAFLGCCCLFLVGGFGFFRLGGFMLGDHRGAGISRHQGSNP